MMVTGRKEGGEETLISQGEGKKRHIPMARLAAGKKEGQL